MRNLLLTSPEMRGEDVRTLQRALNDRLHARKSRVHLAEDGIFGRETLHAVKVIAYDLGLHDYNATPAVQRLIIQPHYRNPGELWAARKREEERKAASEAAGGAVGLDAIVAHAHRFLGTHEQPPESNWGEPYPADWEREFGFDSGVSWCGCFSGAMVNLAGGHVTDRVAFCPYIEADARSRSNGFDRWVPNHGEGVEPGWLVLFNWVGGSEPEHVEIVKKVQADQLITIGGNTGGFGGEVAEQGRPFNLTVGYARPRV
jgi:hypothetical protein